MNDLTPSVSQGIKLASIAVHADELLSPGGSVEFDGTAIRGLLCDPEVRAYLDALRPLALLPEPRAERASSAIEHRSET
jgi:hypothetical protein